MLNAHNALRPVPTRYRIRVTREHVRVHQIRDRDVDRCRWGFLEAQLAVPRHVLDGHERAIGQDDHVVIPVADEDAVSGLDDLGQNMLNWI